LKITDEMLADAVKISESIMGVLLNLGLKRAGGTHAHYSRRIKNLNLNTSHFTGSCWNRGRISPIRRLSSDILVKRTEGIRCKAKQLVRAMIENGVEHKCSKCYIDPVWMGNALTLDVDHINEDWLDDRIENLRFLCPNCHSQFSRNLIA
jgi:HNH endonuclease